MQHLLDIFLIQNRPLRERLCGGKKLFIYDLLIITDLTKTVLFQKGLKFLKCIGTISILIELLPFSFCVENDNKVQTRCLTILTKQ
jgi:hypothetical protein